METRLPIKPSAVSPSNSPYLTVKLPLVYTWHYEFQSAQYIKQVPTDTQQYDHPYLKAILYFLTTS